MADFDFCKLQDDDEVYQQNNDDDEDNGLQPGTKETTGRWTREEHQIFVKGLEMYGKGWKKIASLIKTRTVVQIRTHAQKYFLKLTKARINHGGGGGGGGEGNGYGGGRGGGGGGGGVLGGGARKKRLRKSDRPLAVAPTLEPFMRMNQASTSNELTDADAETCLYNFLSPSLLETVVPSGVGGAGAVSGTFAAAAAAGEEGGATLVQAMGGTARDVMESVDGDDASSGTMSSSTSSISLSFPTASSARRPPEWYQRGLNVDSLLRDAEGLNWLQDSGSSINILEGLPMEGYMSSSLPPRPSALAGSKFGYSATGSGIASSSRAVMAMDGGSTRPNSALGGEGGFLDHVSEVSSEGTVQPGDKLLQHEEGMGGGQEKRVGNIFNTTPLFHDLSDKPLTSASPHFYMQPSLTGSTPSLPDFFGMHDTIDVHEGKKKQKIDVLDHSVMYYAESPMFLSDGI